MALIEKKKVYSRKYLEIHRGISDQSRNAVIRLGILSGADKPPMSITIGEDRGEALVRELENAARALKRSLSGEAGPEPNTAQVPRWDD